MQFCKTTRNERVGSCILWFLWEVSLDLEIKCKRCMYFFKYCLLIPSSLIFFERKKRGNLLGVTKVVEFLYMYLSRTVVSTIFDLDLVFRASSLAFPFFLCATSTENHVRKSIFETLLDTLKFIIRKYFWCVLSNRYPKVEESLLNKLLLVFPCYLMHYLVVLYQLTMNGKMLSYSSRVN